MNRPGDIVQTFGNPTKCETPLGMTRLVKRIDDDNHPTLENWQVEYLDDEGHFYNCLIKRTNGEKQT
jgi:hypothetical protein